MKRLVEQLLSRIASGEVLYIHCHACQAACKAGDAAQCDAAAELLLAVAPNHPLALAAQAVGFMQQGEWSRAVKRCDLS